MMRRTLHAVRTGALQVRHSSTALTAEEIKAGAEKAKRHSTFMQSTILPKSLTGASPSFTRTRTHMHIHTQLDFVC